MEIEATAVIPFDEATMDEVKIPNEATYWPVALTDVMLAAPFVSRVLLGAWLPGRIIQAGALGIYLASSLEDWIERREMRKIDFLTEFDAGLGRLRTMPSEARDREIRELAERVNDGFTPERLPRAELTVQVDGHLTDYIASITGQRVETSTRVRDNMLMQWVFPFALGGADILSSDIAIFRDVGYFEPHVIAHEFCHRKGYYKELEAQALAYLALASSGEPSLVQSAQCERLNRNLRVIAGDDAEEYVDQVERLGLRAELKEAFLALRPPLRAVDEPIAAVMKRIYEERMKLTGQTGLSDYDEGFLDFLYTFETSDRARQTPRHPTIH